jgi:hypothetical protein
MNNSLSSLLSLLNNKGFNPNTNSRPIEQLVLNHNHRQEIVESETHEKLRFNNHTPDSNSKEAIDERLNIISVLMKQQEGVEVKLLQRYEAYNKQFAEKEEEIEAYEIINSNAKINAARKELDTLVQVRKEYELEMYKRMEALVRSQQEILEDKQFSCFFVTQDPGVINKQLWVLAPYVDALSRK